MHYSPKCLSAQSLGGSEKMVINSSSSWNDRVGKQSPGKDYWEYQAEKIHLYTSP